MAGAQNFQGGWRAIVTQGRPGWKQPGRFCFWEEGGQARRLTKKGSGPPLWGRKAAARSSGTLTEKKNDYTSSPNGTLQKPPLRLHCLEGGFVLVREIHGAKCFLRIRRLRDPGQLIRC